MIHESPNPTRRPYQMVVGLDFSELSDRALLTALELAALQRETDIHVLVVGERHGHEVRLPNDVENRSEEDARTHSRDHVAKLASEYRAERGTLPVEQVAVYVVTGDPAKQITALARAVDADLIVVGTHGEGTFFQALFHRGVERAFLGSVAEAVVRTAPCAVHVVRPRDFVRGEKVPEIQAPLNPGERHLRPFLHGRTYHYVDRNSIAAPRVMPVS